MRSGLRLTICSCGKLLNICEYKASVCNVFVLPYAKMLSCSLEEALGITAARVWYCSFTHKLTVQHMTLSGIQGQRQGVVPHKDHSPHVDCCASEAVMGALTWQ